MPRRLLAHSRVGSPVSICLWRSISGCRDPGAVGSGPFLYELTHWKASISATLPPTFVRRWVNVSTPATSSANKAAEVFAAPSVSG